MLESNCKTILSEQNKTYKAWQKLKQRKHRMKEKKFLIEGIKLVAEAIASGLEVEALILCENKSLEQLVLTLESTVSASEKPCCSPVEISDVPIYILSEKLFLGLSETDSPQGLMAVAQMIYLEDQDVVTFSGHHQLPSEGNDDGAKQDDKSILVLDRLQDPGNLGTILRTAEAAGIEEIWCLKGTGDLYSPKVVRASAGAIFRVKIRFMSGPNEVLERAALLEKNLIVTSLKTDQNYYETDLRNSVIVIGNEGSGVCDQFLESHRSTKVKIPMENQVESLNAAVAAALLMYESKRQLEQSIK